MRNGEGTDNADDLRRGDCLVKVLESWMKFLNQGIVFSFLGKFSLKLTVNFLMIPIFWYLFLKDGRGLRVVNCSFFFLFLFCAKRKEHGMGQAVVGGKLRRVKRPLSNNDSQLLFRKYIYNLKKRLPVIWHPCCFLDKIGRAHV